MDVNYKILGLNNNATLEDIKKSYKNLSLKTHPDHGGNNYLFNKVKEAYETLTSDNLDLINNKSVKLIENKKYNKNEYNFF